MRRRISRERAIERGKSCDSARVMFAHIFGARVLGFGSPGTPPIPGVSFEDTSTR